MDNSLIYSQIITQVLRKSSESQPGLQNIKIRSVCDVEAKEFLIIATGWDKGVWQDTILFHARLEKGKVVIEDDNFEEGLTEALITAGIASEDIITSFSQQQKYLSLQS